MMHMKKKKTAEKTEPLNIEKELEHPSDHSYIG